MFHVLFFTYSYIFVHSLIIVFHVLFFIHILSYSFIFLHILYIYSYIFLHSLCGYSHTLYIGTHTHIHIPCSFPPPTYIQCRMSVNSSAKIFLEKSSLQQRRDRRVRRLSHQRGLQQRSQSLSHQVVSQLGIYNRQPIINGFACDHRSLFLSLTCFNMCLLLWFGFRVSHHWST